MTFTLFKIAWTLVRPGTLIVLMLVAGALVWSLGDGRWRLAGQALTIGGIAILVAFLFVPLGSLVTAPLERRVVPAGLPDEIDGIVILGGAFHPPLTSRHGQPAVNEAGERILSGLALARRHGDARVVFAGGSNLLFPGSTTEAAVAQSMFAELGFTGSRFLFESESRNTRENAINSKRLVAPRDGEAWVLVTSAAHMPRALGVFAAAGWPMLAHPVDFRSHGSSEPLADMNVAEELALFEYGVREWLGLAAYRLRGWTRSFWPPEPGPAQPSG